MVKIGNININGDIILAPMAGYTDAGFRMLAARYGAALTVTEMVSAKGLCYGNENTVNLLKISAEEKVCAAQIFGGEAEFIGKAVRHEALKPFQIIDINMGCPVAKIVKNNEGSALLKDVDRVYEIVKAAVNNADKPVTVKIRSGFSESSINAVEVARAIEAAGGSAVTVHARTREQFYSGSADVGIISLVKRAVKIPVIGNGDVVTREDYIKMKEVTGCDAVAVGRGALGRPYIFAQMADKQYEFVLKDAVVNHMTEILKFMPERTATNVMKAHLCYYAKNTGCVKEVRKAISSVKSLDGIYNIIDTFL